MKRSRFSEEQIIGILKEHQAGLSATELCRKYGFSDATFYKWRFNARRRISQECAIQFVFEYTWLPRLKFNPFAILPFIGSRERCCLSFTDEH